MNDWQQNIGRAWREGIKKGEFTVLKSRNAIGKSMYVQMKFSSCWTKWEGVWSWRPRVSSHTGKMIWGKIMVRENKLVLGSNGRRIYEHVSPKEAYEDQKDDFKRALSNG